ncbi:hypothetical protein PMAYCL1PPCAC_22316 [Pristionchus mayeri]|uniref:Uncharacterized protein n=1 Tax=Pristionchus mayeri TaxID=1317129 RepID=A0AAN5CWS3_9BILA|nr:hypothetical protein PMAYCL1PPCAC_22316 [Pristionchus mayeri]
MGFLQTNFQDWFRFLAVFFSFLIIKCIITHGYTNMLLNMIIDVETKNAGWLFRIVDFLVPLSIHLGSEWLSMSICGYKKDPKCKEKKCEHWPGEHSESADEYEGRSKIVKCYWISYMDCHYVRVLPSLLPTLRSDGFCHDHTSSLAGHH